jgi:hypothetical protein
MECPRSLQVAAGLVAVQGVVLAVWGAVELARAFVGHPNDRGTAILLGAVVLVYALGVLVAAWGLWGARRWAQTPTYMVAFFAVVVGLGQLHTVPVLPVALIVLGAATFVAASTPASRAALGGI